MLLAQEPAIDDVPFVASPGLEIQQLGTLVLKLEIELQGVPTGRVAGIDGMRLQPSLPFLREQYLRFFLLHIARPD